MSAHPDKLSACAVALGVCAMVMPATASVQAGPEPAVRQASGEVQPAGRGRLTWWGFDVYDAALWTAPGFRADRFESHAFVLELSYLRAFTGAEIASASLQQMRRHGRIEPGDAARWQSELTRVLPDVKPGDRLAGVHQPGQGATFFHNARPLGTVGDAQFARLFFAIWLGEASSEPALRRSLLGEGAP